MGEDPETGKVDRVASVLNMRVGKLARTVIWMYANEFGVEKFMLMENNSLCKNAL